MADDYSKIRLESTQSTLNLDSVLLSDSFGNLVDKINNNFKELEENGGGPMGQLGPQGKPGCRGVPGAPGPAGDSDLNWKNILSEQCDSDLPNNEADAETIMNRLTNRTLLLTNLSLTDDELIKLREIHEAEETMEKVSNTLSKYKIKVYNADAAGRGEHIHFLNSQAAQTSFKYLCKSGFSISNDWVGAGTNREILRFTGQRNDDISNHYLDSEFNVDLFSIRNNEDAQGLEINPGTGVESTKKLKLTLDTQTAVNEVNLPDKTGYNSVWVDTNERGEAWELITGADLAIYRSIIWDTEDAYTPYDIPEAGDHWVELHADSFIRFKRNNDFVMIDFHLGVQRVTTKDKFTLQNLQVRPNIATVACRTIGYYPTSILENESIDEDSTAESFFGHFKVDSVDLSATGLTGGGFQITNKMPPSIYNMTFDSTTGNNELFWITGQTWATIGTADAVCELLEITQDAVCPTVVIQQN